MSVPDKNIIFNTLELNAKNVKLFSFKIDLLNDDLACPVIIPPNHYAEILKFESRVCEINSLDANDIPEQWKNVGSYQLKLIDVNNGIDLVQLYCPVEYFKLKKENIIIDGAITPNLQINVDHSSTTLLYLLSRHIHVDRVEVAFNFTIAYYPKTHYDFNQGALI